MLISLGQSAKPPTDVVDALLECHQRIRRFTALAVTVGTRPELPPSEVQEACAGIERYFRVALPLHVRDEEEGVIARLEGLSPELDAALEQMDAEHDQHAPLLARLFEALAAVQRAPEAAGSRAALRDAGTALRAAFDPHLQLEEEVIFPALRLRVSPEVRVAMLGELRARRG